MADRQVEQFLVEAQQSGLMSAADVAQLTAAGLADNSATEKTLAAELVKRGLLSSYQAELLLDGRANEAVVAGRYRVLEKLGEGGMGAVYKAQDMRLQRLVAILTLGKLTQVQIVGNRIWGGALYSAIQFEHLDPDSQNVLLANNTVLECATSFRLWDDAVKGRGIVLRNNLFLGGSHTDMLFIDNGGSPAQPRGPGEPLAVTKQWEMSHNWRESKRPTGTDAFSRSWIPPTAQDELRDEISVLSRLPGDANFLQPAKDSPLATGGAGGDLPSYVGAVPPAGEPRWEWKMPVVNK